jgi:hypothetical protein
MRMSSPRAQDIDDLLAGLNCELKPDSTATLVSVLAMARAHFRSWDLLQSPMVALPMAIGLRCACWMQNAESGVG